MNDLRPVDADAPPPAEASAVTEALVAALVAVDPVGLGGVVLRAGAGPARDRWLALLAALLPAATPIRRMPLHIDDDRLLGGLDLAATLQAGRPIAQRGLFAEADGGLLLLAMAERLGAATAASVAAVLDHGEVGAGRPGLSAAMCSSRIGVVALDEGFADDEQVPACLRERLAFRLSLTPLPVALALAAAPASESAPAASLDLLGPVEPSAEPDDKLFDRRGVAAARERVARVRVDSETIEGLCAAALTLGIDSVRAPMLACRAARAAAALDGREETNRDDAALAAALVLAPRATRLPTPASSDENTEEHGASGDERAAPKEPAAASPSEDPAAKAEQADPADPAEMPAPGSPDTGTSRENAESDPATDTDTDAGITPVDDLVLEAALAAIPPHLLAQLALGRQPQRATSAGRVGTAQSGGARGRPVGARRGRPQRGAA